MGLACVLIAHLRARLELRRRPHLRERPTVIVDRSGGQPVVADFLPTAMDVRTGMPLEQALSLHGAAMVVEADEAHYREEFQGILAALQGVSDRVEAAELGTAYVGLSGLEEMYGGEEENEAETMEEVFAQARNAESEAEELLVDDGWKPVETGPEAVEVNGNGANGSGPTVELVPVNGHANGNGSNGHHDEATEPQQSLFSWAEFMAEEPVKPKGRGRKPQPAAASLFEWALEMEQEREGEPVGAGR